MDREQSLNSDQNKTSRGIPRLTKHVLTKLVIKFPSRKSKARKFRGKCLDIHVHKDSVKFQIEEQAYRKLSMTTKVEN